MHVWQSFFFFWFQGGPLNDTKIFIFFSKGSDLITGLLSPFCLVGLLLDWLATAWLCPDLYWTVVYWRVFVRNFNYIKWLFFQVHRPNGRLIDMSKSILDLQRQILSICNKNKDPGLQSSSHLPKWAPFLDI